MISSVPAEIQITCKSEIVTSSDYGKNYSTLSRLKRPIQQKYASSASGTNAVHTAADKLVFHSASSDNCTSCDEPSSVRQDAGDAESLDERASNDHGCSYRRNSGKIVVERQIATYHCPDCSECLYTRKSLMRHISLKHSYSYLSDTKTTKEKQYKCEICKHRFARNTSLTLHQYKFHSAKPRNLSFNCAQHVENRKFCHKEPADAKMYHCAPCYSLFYTLTDLRYHKFQYHDKNHCHLCQQDFSGRVALNEHAKACHPGDTVYRKFICEFCSKVFVIEKRLNDHIQSKHLGIVHRCQICDKELGSLETLQHHLKVHNSDTYRTCDICGKQFCRLSQLAGHMRTHHPYNVPEKDQFACQLCEKMFSQPASLKRHMESKHEGKTFPCDLCGKTLTASRYLRRHRKKHHNEN